VETEETRRHIEDVATRIRAVAPPELRIADDFASWERAIG
jgi:hypothetical protein